MPPDMVSGLFFVRAGHETLTFRWTQPGLGTGVLLGYEYRLGSGTWRPTQSTATEYTIQGLDPGTQYPVSIRAVTTVGSGSGSAQVVATTLALSTASAVLFPRSETTGETSLDLFWTVPEDDGGSDIIDYEICIIDEGGTVTPFGSTGGTETRHRVRGLGIGHRYGFRLRAITMAGAGDHTSIFYGVPARPSTRLIPPGQRLPLIDVDRQSLIVRLANKDCRIHIWWQPSDSSWWGSLEVPVNNPVVQSRRLPLNSGLLDRISDVLPGNLTMRELGDSGAEPQRDAWRRPTHGLVWEPR